MKKKESPFFGIDNHLLSQNISSPRFEELLSIYSNDNAIEQPIEEALKDKRNIFERNNFRALNDGHKEQSSEDDLYLSSVSDNRFDQESVRSRTNSLIKQQRSVSIMKNQQINQTSLIKVNTGLIIDSTINLQGQGIKSSSKIDKYQSFVQQFEVEEDKIRKNKELIKQKSNQTNEHSSKRNSVINKGKIGLNDIWAVKGFTIKQLKFQKYQYNQEQNIKQQIYVNSGSVQQLDQYLDLSNSQRQKLKPQNLDFQQEKYFLQLEMCLAILNLSQFLVKLSNSLVYFQF